MAKYLDSNGVAHLWERIKSYVSANSGSIGAVEVSFDKLENPMRQNGNFTWDGNSFKINVDNASVLLPETNFKGRATFKGQATFENVCEINGPAIFNGPARPKFNTRPVFSEPLDSGALGDGTVTMDKLAQDVKDAMGGSGGASTAIAVSELGATADGIKAAGDETALATGELGVKVAELEQRLAALETVKE